MPAHSTVAVSSPPGLGCTWCATARVAAVTETSPSSLLDSRHRLRQSPAPPSPSLFLHPSVSLLFLFPHSLFLSRICRRRHCAYTDSGFGLLGASYCRSSFPAAASSPTPERFVMVVKSVMNRGVGLPPSETACQNSVTGIPADSYSGDKFLDLCLLWL